VAALKSSWQYRSSDQVKQKKHKDSIKIEVLIKKFMAGA